MTAKGDACGVDGTSVRAGARHPAANEPGRRSDPDAVIAAFATRQHGVVTRAQLIGAGVAPHRIDYRVGQRRLRLLHRGVYGVGALRSRHERAMAAVLACGETAVLSHRSAGALWDVLPTPTEDAAVEVSIRRGDRAPGPGVRVHRIPGLAPDETTVREGIPTTRPARTILDLAACVGARELERAVARAVRRGLASPEQIARLLARHAGRSGTRMLRVLLAAEGGPALTRSEAESRFLALVRRARLGAPEANARVEGYEVDFLWRSERLIVEIDGFAFHASSAAFERDRRRDASLTAAGFPVVRVTWHQLTKEPEALLVRLAQALARRPGA